jgi:hypothetical protein
VLEKCCDPERDIHFELSKRLISVSKWSKEVITDDSYAIVVLNKEFKFISYSCTMMRKVYKVIFGYGKDA